jgi:hypothetical protein
MLPLPFKLNQSGRHGFVTGTLFTCQEPKRWAMRLMQFQWVSDWLNGRGRAKNALYVLDVTVPEGEVLDVLLQAKRDTKAARKLMRKLLKRQGMAPDEWVTDENPAYGAALRELKLTQAPHTRRKRANNRAESSHLPVRRRERKRQGFKSPRSAQRFLSLHAATYNIFTVPRHLTTARIHRLFRAEAFEAWRNAAGVAA